MDLTSAIQFGQLVNEAYKIDPHDLTDKAGTPISVDPGTGPVGYIVVASIYANDLATDMNPQRGNDRVSMGLILQATATGDAVIAIRGTEGIYEWIHDAQFLLVPCPFLASAGSTEDGFTAMYKSLNVQLATGPASVTSALAQSALRFSQPVRSLTICGHSLGGALVTLLALDVAANTSFRSPTVYSYASPRTGDPAFACMYNHVVPNTFRIANRVDLVPNLPLPPLYEHVQGVYELNPVKLGIPPRVLVKFTVPCEHILTTYLYLLSQQAGGKLQLDAKCVPD
jgi:hypothetical protein